MSKKVKTLSHYICESWFDYSFTCNQTLKEIPSFTEMEYEGRKVVVQVVELTNENVVACNAWLNSVLIYAVKVPYIKNHRYTLYYSFKATNSGIFTNEEISEKYNVADMKTLFNDPTKPIELEYEGLRITKKMDPIEAKKLFKRLQKAKLIGKVFWDVIDGYWDVTCRACRHPDSKVSQALSCPGIGYVYRVGKYEHCDKRDELNHNPMGTEFLFDKTVYVKIPIDQQDLVSYYNKEEYAEKIKIYEPLESNIEYFNKEAYEKWCSKRTISTTWKLLVGKALEDSEYPKFEDLWDMCCSIDKIDYLYFDKKFNRYASIIDEGRAESDYEKVICLEWLEYNVAYPPFDKFWDEATLTQKEIDSNGNIRGGAYRLFETHLNDTTYKLWDEGIFAKGQRVEEKDWNELIRLGAAEKVVTFGWHSSHPKDSVECPVCRAMYDSAMAHNWIGWRKALSPILFSKPGRWFTDAMGKRYIKKCTKRMNKGRK